MDLDDSDNYVPGLASQNNSRGHSRFARRAAMATSRFKGVCFNKKCKRWQASTNAYGKYLYLGLYSTETAAAQVYDLASLKIRGRNSQTNFPAEQYLDVDGQLPADEHLDGVIAQLKAEAARQLLAELQDDPMLHGHQPGGNPAEKIALIRQRVGLRRMTGLEQDLLEIIAAEGGELAENVAAPGVAMVEQDEHAEAAASPAGSPGRTAESLPPVQHEQLDADRLAAVVHMSDLSIPTMHQLLQMDEQDIAATSAPQAALDSAGNQLPGSGGGMLETQQLMSGTDWLGASNLPMSAASMLPCVPVVAPAAAAAIPREPAFKQQGDLQHLQQLQLQPQASLAFPFMVADRQSADLTTAAAMQPAAQQQPQATSASPATAAVASSSNSPNGATYNHCAIAAQVAAGNPFSADGNISCVNISWLQGHLPPHCQLQHVMNHAGGLCGMLYAQPSTAAPSGVLWGGAVWDGGSFRYSQLYGSAAEAARLCGSVLQLIAGCKQGDSEANLTQAAANCG